MREIGSLRRIIDVLLGSLFILAGDTRTLGRRGAVAETRVLLLLGLGCQSLAQSEGVRPLRLEIFQEYTLFLFSLRTHGGCGCQTLSR